MADPHSQGPIGADGGGHHRATEHFLAMQLAGLAHGQAIACAPSDQVHVDAGGAVVAAAISSDRPLGVGVSHGWTPSSEPMLVNQSRGTLLSSLDDRPALVV
ncbi:MAG: FIST N-terminal domain-containing protein [Cyanobium sp.]